MTAVIASAEKIKTFRNKKSVEKFAGFLFKVILEKTQDVLYTFYVIIFS
jgi:hypothetical protein